MNEDLLLKTVFAEFKQSHEVIVGPGDDCAVIETGNGCYLLLAADQVIGDVHYFQDSTPAEKIARKLLRRNLSDIAAMGGTPSLALSTAALAVAHRSDSAWLKSFFLALGDEAEKWSVSLCGGDVACCDNDHDVFSLTILGQVEKNKLCLRGNAKHGDRVYCTGVLGNALASGHHLDFVPRMDVARFLSGAYTNCMIDISDGLLKDLGRIVNCSETGAAICPSQIPLRTGADIEKAMVEGEDYELLFTVGENREKALLDAWPFEEIGLSRIGFINGDHAGQIYDLEAGNFLNQEQSGFDHFHD